MAAAYSDTIGWVMAAIVVAVYAAITFVAQRRRASAGLETQQPLLLVLRVAIVAAAIVFAVAEMNSYFGVPLAVLIFVGFVAFFGFWTTHTGFGGTPK